MTVILVWTHQAKKDLTKMDPPIAQRIFSQAEEMAQLDLIKLEKVNGQDYFKFRIGDYRLLVDKLPASNTIGIKHIAHRKQAYKNL